jgi:hypothetical protein
MRRCRIVLAVAAVAAAVLAAGLRTGASSQDAVVCLKPAWGNSEICVLGDD